MRILYDIVFFIFSIFYIPSFIAKGKHTHGFWSRFGSVPREIQESLKNKKVIWVHAVSVGEVAGALRFLESLRVTFKDARFVLTTTTVTGHETAAKFKKPEDTLLYFPADFRSAVKSFINAIHPSAVILMETEIWPNLVFELDAKKIPLFIVNGRISDKAIKPYRRVRFLIQNVLKRFTAIGVQDEQMRSRFVELGAPADKVKITGNMKFDWRPPASPDPLVAAMQNYFKQKQSVIFMAGSTHEGEEERLFETYTDLKARHPELVFVIAPRHPHRLESIETAAEKKKVRVCRISYILEGSQDSLNAPQDAIYLLDKMGVLASAYEMADLVFVGGSLVPVGGHNPIEPAFFGKPILFGAHMHNFKEIAKAFKEGGAALEVSETNLAPTIERLLASRSEREALGTSAKHLIKNHEGSVVKNTNLIAGVLK